jgi:hypothetical protein
VEEEGVDVGVALGADEFREAGEDGEVGLAEGVEGVYGDAGGLEFGADLAEGGEAGDLDVVAAGAEAHGELADDDGGAAAVKVGGEEEELGRSGNHRCIPRTPRTQRCEGQCLAKCIGWGDSDAKALKPLVDADGR